MNSLVRLDRKFKTICAVTKKKWYTHIYNDSIASGKLVDSWIFHRVFLPHKSGPAWNRVSVCSPHFWLKFSIQAKNEKQTRLSLFIFIFFCSFLKNDMARKFLIRFTQRLNPLERYCAKIVASFFTSNGCNKTIFCRIIFQFMTWSHSRQILILFFLVF